MSHNERVAPSGKSATPESLAAAKLLDATHSTRDLAARARRHDHGVLVLAERKDGVIVSQCFATLEAAERKVDRTRARGLSASLTLVRLVAVPTADLDALGGAR